MRQAIHQHLIVTYAISLGLMTVCMSLLQPIPSASAQQLIGTISQGTSGTGTQKKDAQSLTRKPHRLIRKSQSALTATLQPIPLDASKSTSSTAVPISTLNDTATQPKDTSVSSKIGAVAAPAITPLGLMSTAAATTSTTVTSYTATPHSLLSGATANAGAATANASIGASTPPAGRSMSRLASEMPGLAQLINPASSSPPPSSTVPPTLGASPAALSFTATQGATNPAPQTVTISNSGSTLNWSASETAAWLSLSPATGAGAGPLAASVNTAGLATGTYTSTITVAASGATSQAVGVTLTVVAAPTLGASPAALSFTATQGATNPAPQTVTISNSGGTLNWSASETAAWLSLSPATGAGAGPLAASVNTAGLAPGTYTSTITVAASGATSQAVGVTLTVNPPATSSATLTWNANTDPDLSGYKVYQATASGAYGAPVVTLQGNVTSYVATGLQVGTTYFFIVTAYDTAGNESTNSNEVSKSIF